jgi:hypothetical protein
MDTMQLSLYVGLPAAIIIAALVVWFLKARDAQGDGGLLYFRCPGCGRRIRYVKKQVGHQGMCSNCKTRLIFPLPGSSMDKHP